MKFCIYDDESKIDETVCYGRFCEKSFGPLKFYVWGKDGTTPHLVIDYKLWYRDLAYIDCKYKISGTDTWHNHRFTAEGNVIRMNCDDEIMRQFIAGIISIKIQFKVVMHKSNGKVPYQMWSQYGIVCNNAT